MLRASFLYTSGHRSSMKNEGGLNYNHMSYMLLDIHVFMKKRTSQLWSFALYTSGHRNSMKTWKAPGLYAHCLYASGHIICMNIGGGVGYNRFFYYYGHRDSIKYERCLGYNHTFYMLPGIEITWKTKVLWAIIIFV